MNTLARRLGLLATLGVAMVLGGCAMTRLIDSDVQSFVTAPAIAAQARYRFERLPSQVDARGQDRIEALATTALAKVGLQLDPVNPAYGAEVSFQTLILARNPSYDPWMGGYGPRGAFGGFGFGMSVEQPWYRNTVHLLLRNLSSGRVEFESTAVFESPWSDVFNIYPVILDAALQGFPNPPLGPRKVVIELPPGAPAH